MDKLFKFYTPSTGYVMDDLQSKIMEVVMELFGDKQDIDTSLMSMLDNAQIIDKNVETALIKHIAGVRCIKKLIAENKEAFTCFLLEREQYKNIQSCTEM